MDRGHTIALALALLLAAPAAHAAPAPTFTAANVTVSETSPSATVTVLKSAKANSYSKINVQTADGSCRAGANYSAVNVTLTFGNSTLKQTVAVPLQDNTTYDGPCTILVKLTPVRFAQVSSGATITITDNELPPAPTPTPDPHPCYDYSGTTPLGPVPGSNCPARYCPGYANPVDWSLPCPGTPSGFGVGALVTRQGLVYKIVGAGIPDLFISGGGTIYPVVYVSDTTGQYYLANEPTIKAEVQYWMEADLSPAP